MFVLFAQVFVFYNGKFCDCLTGRQIILSLKIKKLLYVMQTFEDTIHQFVAFKKNCVLFAFHSDNQRIINILEVGIIIKILIFILLNLFFNFRGHLLK